jgi:hypothetical protein
MNESSFLVALTFFINLNESHFFQDFIKEHIVYFILSRRGNIQELYHSVVFLYKLLGNILLIIEV